MFGAFTHRLSRQAGGQFHISGSSYFYFIFSLFSIQSFIIRLIISGRVGKSSSSFRRSSIFFMISL